MAVSWARMRSDSAKFFAARAARRACTRALDLALVQLQEQPVVHRAAAAGHDVVELSEQRALARRDGIQRDALLRERRLRGGDRRRLGDDVQRLLLEGESALQAVRAAQQR